MKRTLLLCKTPLKPQKKPLCRSPMSPSPTGKLFRHARQLLERVASRGKRTNKKRPATETAHFKRIAALSCARCGIAGYSQAAHSNRQQDAKGAAIKAHYLATCPLCCSRPGILGSHVEHDQCIAMTREEANARTTLYIADTRQKLGVSQ